jgi:transcription-repair coupling factor (superfamily II helicase)
LIARIQRQCRPAKVARVDAGPQAIAITFRADRREDPSVTRAVEASNGALAWREDRLVWSKSGDAEGERLHNVSRLLRRLARA